nr:MAG TPA_asm: hypothetical protein [Caudoviricetes sp.]
MKSNAQIMHIANKNKRAPDFSDALKHTSENVYPN